MLHKFKCVHCGSEEIVVHKWVDCKEDAIIDHTTDHIEYGPPVINPNKANGEGSDFFCKNCERPLVYQGMPLRAEAGLEVYLSHTPEEIQATNDAILEEEAAAVLYGNNEELDDLEDYQMSDN